jgi:hypothetical protein
VAEPSDGRRAEQFVLEGGHPGTMWWSVQVIPSKEQACRLRGRLVSNPRSNNWNIPQGLGFNEFLNSKFGRIKCDLLNVLA